MSKIKNHKISVRFLDADEADDHKQKDKIKKKKKSNLMWLEGKLERKINCIGFENKKTLNVRLKLVQSGRAIPLDTENTKKYISGIVRVNKNIANSEKQRKGN